MRITHWMLVLSSILAGSGMVPTGIARAEDAKLPAQSELAQPSPEVATAEQIDLWIGELDSNRFLVREAATMRLIEAGSRAISQLADALPGSSLEVTTRGIYVLRELAVSPETGTQEAARAALVRLAAAEQTPAGRRAVELLTMLDKIRQARALEELEQLGAKLGRQFVQLGVPALSTENILEIGESWKGTDQDLQRLKWLADVRQIHLEGDQISDQTFQYVEQMPNLHAVVIKHAAVTDEALIPLRNLKKLSSLEIKYSPIGDGALEHLKALSNVKNVIIYGTKISKKGAQDLQDTFGAVVHVDYRQGGFLGVGGQVHPLGCQITVVNPGSAAAKAGLSPLDVIITYDGKKVEDFDWLPAVIGENAPGDEVVIEILRGRETLIRTIVLGERD